MKLRKNEMKLRKKQIKLPKNCFVPPWRFPIFHRGIFDFLGEGVVVSESSECIGAIRAIGAIGGIGAIGRVTVVGTHGRASVPVKVRRVAPCRDARSVRPSPSKVTMSSSYDDWVICFALTQRTPSDLTLPCVPTPVTRLALTQRTHRSCVPTPATRDICGIYDERGVAYVQK